MNCRFEGKYPFGHVNGFIVKNCLFTEGARAALWYSQNLKMTDTKVEAPKMFREMDGLELAGVVCAFESAAGIVIIVLIFYHQAPGKRGTFEAGYSTDVY